MKKNLLFLIFIVAVFSINYSQSLVENQSAPVDKKPTVEKKSFIDNIIFDFSPFTNFAIGKKNSVGFCAELKYAIKNNLSVGLRYAYNFRIGKFKDEVAKVSKLSEDDTEAKINGGGIGFVSTYAVVADWHFIPREKFFRPYAGIVLGYQNVSELTLATVTTNSNTSASTIGGLKGGGFLIGPRLGLDLGRVRFNFKYDLLLDAPNEQTGVKIGDTEINDAKIKYANYHFNQFGIEIYLRIGGRNRKK